MIGQLDPRERKVTVVGAGIAGLMISYLLDREGWEVTLLEASDRAGGLIETQQTPYGIAEKAAHSVLVTEPVHRFFSDIGVELAPIRPDSRARFIMRDGKRRKMPLGPGELLTMLAKAAFARAPAHADLDMQSWADRHVGPAARRYLIAPMIRGIYGSPLPLIDQPAAFPFLTVAPGQTLLSAVLSSGKSKPRAPRSNFKKQMMAPVRGMGAVPAALDRILGERLGARYRKGSRVAELPSAANVILAVPAYDAARLLESRDPELARALSEVSYAPLAAVTVYADKGRLPKGVGVLMGEGEPLKTLGVLFNSASFPARVSDEEKVASMTFIVELGSNMSAADIEEIVRSEFPRIFPGSESNVLGASVSAWQRAIPRYGADLPIAWSLAKEPGHWCGKPGQILFGNYTGQVSLRGMIESAVSMAAQLHSV